jgi:GAF domain-containing protein
MKMYVANCTGQIQQFVYQLPGVRSSRTQTIAAGGQIVLSGNLQPEEIDAVIEQHSLYGMHAALTVAQVRSNIQLLYSIDKEITVNQMRQALERNLQFLTLKGQTLRQEAAVAVNNLMQEDRPDEFKHVDLEVVEQPKDGGTPLINENIQVRRGDYTGGGGKPNRASRRKAA